MGNKQKAKPVVEENKSDQMFNVIFEFKMQAKELTKQSKKSEGEYLKMIDKVKKVNTN